MRDCAQECTCVVYIEGVYTDFDNVLYACVFCYRLDERLTDVYKTLCTGVHVYCMIQVLVMLYSFIVFD